MCRKEVGTHEPDLWGVWLVVVAAGGVLVWRFFPAYRRYRGKRVITCPETHEHEAVEVDAVEAGWAALRGHREVHLQSCTRWPERQDCGQECLAEIESAPEGCLMRNILGRWYAGKACTLCGKEFGELDWYVHKPGLLDAEGVTWEWSEVDPRQVHAMLESCRPVCWDCHVVEKAIREHPDRITFRPQR